MLKSNGCQGWPEQWTQGEDARFTLDLERWLVYDGDKPVCGVGTMGADFVWPHIVAALNTPQGSAAFDGVEFDTRCDQIGRPMIPNTPRVQGRDDDGNDSNRILVNLIGGPEDARMELTVAQCLELVEGLTRAVGQFVKRRDIHDALMHVEVR